MPINFNSGKMNNHPSEFSSDDSDDDSIGEHHQTDEENKIDNFTEDKNLNSTSKPIDVPAQSPTKRMQSPETQKRLREEKYAREFRRQESEKQRRKQNIEDLEILKKQKDLKSNRFDQQPNAEPNAELNAEPNAEDNAEINAELNAEDNAEPNAEDETYNEPKAELEPIPREFNAETNEPEPESESESESETESSDEFGREEIMKIHNHFKSYVESDDPETRKWALEKQAKLFKRAVEKDRYRKAAKISAKVGERVEFERNRCREPTPQRNHIDTEVIFNAELSEALSEFDSSFGFDSNLRKLDTLYRNVGKMESNNILIQSVCLNIHEAFCDQFLKGFVNLKDKINKTTCTEKEKKMMKKNVSLIEKKLEKHRSHIISQSNEENREIYTFFQMQSPEMRYFLRDVRVFKELIDMFENTNDSNSRVDVSENTSTHELELALTRALARERTLTQERDLAFERERTLTQELARSRENERDLVRERERTLTQELARERERDLVLAREHTLTQELSHERERDLAFEHERTLTQELSRERERDLAFERERTLTQELARSRERDPARVPAPAPAPEMPRHLPQNSLPQINRNDFASTTTERQPPPFRSGNLSEDKIVINNFFELQRDRTPPNAQSNTQSNTKSRIITINNFFR